MKLDSTARDLNKRPTILVFSHLRWDFVFQRPQHLLTRAAEEFDVIFVEEPLVQPGSTKARIEERGRVRLVQPLLPEGTTPGEALARQRELARWLAAEAGRPLTLWFYTPAALIFARDIAADRIVFDKMDELSAFRFAPPELVALEAELIERADVVFTGGAAMFEAARGRHDNLHCFPSSIDAAHFGAARSGELAEPADQAGIGDPRIGFFGVIDERFDAELLGEVAASRPDWHFVMIGPTAKIDPAELPRASNIHWLGPKSYAELPAYLAHWDAGWMPFAINEATRFISPTKTPEFLAAGLPLVSTPITDVVRPYGEEQLVHIAASAAETVEALEKALEGPSKTWLDRVDARLAQGSWDRTWEAMRELIAVPARQTTQEKEPAHV